MASVSLKNKWLYVIFITNYADYHYSCKLKSWSKNLYGWTMNKTYIKPVLFTESFHIIWRDMRAKEDLRMNCPFQDCLIFWIPAKLTFNEFEMVIRVPGTLAFKICMTEIKLYRERNSMSSGLIIPNLANRKSFWSVFAYIRKISMRRYYKFPAAPIFHGFHIW